MSAAKKKAGNGAKAPLPPSVEAVRFQAGMLTIDDLAAYFVEARGASNDAVYSRVIGTFLEVLSRNVREVEINEAMGQLITILEALPVKGPRNGHPGKKSA